MMKFEVAIEGEKFEYDTFTEAKAKYDSLFAEGYWEVVMRLHQAGRVLFYNRSACAFFPTY